MVASRQPEFVPASYLAGASCLLPEPVGRGLRTPPTGAASGTTEGGVRRPRPAEREELLGRLSPAERLVAIHVAQGLSNKEISSALGRAEPTIKHQISSAMQKLGVQSRCQLIVRLLR